MRGPCLLIPLLSWAAAAPILATPFSDADGVARQFGKLRRQSVTLSQGHRIEKPNYDWFHVASFPLRRAAGYRKLKPLFVGPGSPTLMHSLRALPIRCVSARQI